MHVAVYSGSFNPLHIGHLAIMEHLRDRFDWTYLVVSPKNPLKDSISADTGTDRYRAAVAAVKGGIPLAAGGLVIPREMAEAL